MLCLLLMNWKDLLYCRFVLEARQKFFHFFVDNKNPLNYVVSNNLISALSHCKFSFEDVLEIVALI
jgi:hypothetical protein